MLAAAHSIFRETTGVGIIIANNRAKNINMMMRWTFFEKGMISHSTLESSIECGQLWCRIESDNFNYTFLCIYSRGFNIQLFS